MSAEGVFVCALLGVTIWACPTLKIRLWLAGFYVVGAIFTYFDMYS